MAAKFLSETTGYDCVTALSRDCLCIWLFRMVEWTILLMIELAKAVDAKVFVKEFDG